MKLTFYLALTLSCWLAGTSLAQTPTPPAERLLYCFFFPDEPPAEEGQLKHLALYAPHGFSHGKLQAAEFFDPHSLLAGRNPDFVIVRGELISFVTVSLPVTQLAIQPSGKEGVFFALAGSDGKRPKKGQCLEIGGPLIQQMVTQFRANPKSVDNPQ